MSPNHKDEPETKPRKGYRIQLRGEGARAMPANTYAEIQRKRIHELLVNVRDEVVIARLSLWLRRTRLRLNDHYGWPTGRIPIENKLGDLDALA
jgi:hypothetical protein